MNIAILDDFHDTVRTLEYFGKLSEQNVTTWNDYYKNIPTLSKRLQDT